MSYNYTNQIYIIDEILSNDDCDFAVNYYNNNSQLAHRFRDTFPLTVNLETAPQLLPFLDKICSAGKKIVGNQLEVDWGQICYWPEKSFQQPHHDLAEERTVFTSITYLNDTFNGGYTFFEDELKIKAKKGRTIFFDGQYYLHGVSKVTRGSRYTIPIWYYEKN